MKPLTNHYQRVCDAAEAVAARLDAEGVSTAIILGSGLAAVAQGIPEARSAPYATLPGFPETTVAGHPGRLVCGRLGAHKVLIFCGRVHGYEGYPAGEVGIGVRVAATLGASRLIVTNVSGAVDPQLNVGEIVAISDHLNLTGHSPLVGPNDERLGPRFVDMTDTYTPALRQLAAEVAAAQGLGRLRESVYAGMSGPHYETPAEVRMLRLLGAGLVGMSTVHEVITARHHAMEVLGLSLVANPAAGVSDKPLSHEEVTDAAARGSATLARLVAGIVERLSLT